MLIEDVVVPESRGWPAVKVRHVIFFCTIRRMRDALEAGSRDLVVIHREACPFFAQFGVKLVMARCRQVVHSFDDAVHVGYGNLCGLANSLLYKIKYGSGFNEMIRGGLTGPAAQTPSKTAFVPNVQIL